MASWFNHRTKRYDHRGPSGAHLEEDGWIRNPTLPAGVPHRYVKLYSGRLLEMTALQKGAVDAALEAARQAAKPAKLKAVENEVLVLAAELAIPVAELTYEAAEVVVKDKREKAQADNPAGLPDVLALGLTLLSLWNRLLQAGGTLDDVPEQPHEVV